MCPDVRVAGALVREGHGAHVAGVGLDAQVNSHMSIQVALLHKLFRAVRTFVPRAVMNKNMLLQMKPIEKKV
jgi:hypothetical protein